MTKKVDLSVFSDTVAVDQNAVPRGIAYLRIALPKRGKTYWGARWNATHDVKRTLFLDTEKCTARFPEYNGMTTINLTSWEPPRGSDGKVLAPQARGLFINGKPAKALSFTEAVGLIRAMGSELSESFDTVCVDTIDILQEWSEAYHISLINAKRKEEDKVLTLGELGTAHGSAWSDARSVLIKSLDSLIDICRNVGVDIVMNVHSKTTTQVANVWQRDPALRAGVSSALMGLVDVVGYCNIEDTLDNDGSKFGTVYNGQAYTISYSASSEITTGGSRLGFLVNKTLPNCYQAIVEEYDKTR